MARLAYTNIEKYIITAECITPLHIGSSIGDKSEVLVHPITNTPFIQASSIAGVMRDTSLKVNGSFITEKLFGASSYSKGTNASINGSMIRVSDGTFINSNVKMEYRPRVSINPDTGSVASANISGSNQKAGQKYEIEMIAENEKFCFSIYLYHEKEHDFENALEQIFSELKAEQIQIGGQKSNGCGFVKLVELKKHSFDLKQDSDRKSWIREDELEEKQYLDITNKLDKAKHTSQAYRVNVVAKTEGSMLIKGIAVTEYGEDAPDTENIKNASGNYIIPGSSLKGVLRNRMTFIAGKLKKKNLIDNVFGKTGKTDAKSGNIYVKDTLIGKDSSAVTLHSQRIHIDKFTGGVMQTGLFSEKTVAGKMNMEIIIADKNDPNVTLGLLILTLRDMAAGLINLGSGYNIGHGFVEIERITVESLKKRRKSEVMFGYDQKGVSIIRNDDEAGLIQAGLNSLKK